MRTKSIALLAVPLILAIALAGCSSVGASAPGDVTTTSGGSAAPAAPADKVGTRVNPAPAGTVISLKDVSGNPEYEITFGPVILDGAAVVAEMNDYNPDPKPGFQYLFVPVIYKYVGKTSGTPGIDVRIEFVSAAGTTHKTTDSTIMMSSDLMGINEIYPGASSDGSTVIMVPTADEANGLLTFESDGTSKFFVRLA